METTSLQFARLARLLASAARERGLRVPAFRSPPRVSGVARTVRRGHDGAVIVAVSVRGRPLMAVVADMVEGIVVANELNGVEATRVRTALWELVSGAEGQAA